MCFKGKKQHQESSEKEDMLEFHITWVMMIIPLLISAAVLLVEIHSICNVSGEDTNYLDILRLINTTFIPTHVATTTVVLYQHFSLANKFNQGGKWKAVEDMEIKAEHAFLTTVSTISLAFFYVLFSFGINWGNQIFLIVAQLVYMCLLWKYGIKDKIVRYPKSPKNVISY